MSFEQLKEAIQANDNVQVPDMSNWWSLIADIEKLVPATMLFPKWRGYIKKAARILLYRELCQNPEIESTKDMTSGALWEIHKFLNSEKYGVENCLAVIAWVQENAQTIYKYASEVKKHKLAQDKTRRDNKKVKENVIPF